MQPAPSSAVPAGHFTVRFAALAPPTLEASPALVAVTALATWVALVALTALTARLSVPSLDSLTSLPVMESGTNRLPGSERFLSFAPLIFAAGEGATASAVLARATK